jgi:electron transfer flavoprotein alpha subunit
MPHPTKQGALPTRRGTPVNHDIYVLIEHLQGQVLDISYILLAQARQLAAKTGGKVVGILIGWNQSNLSNNLAADEVYYYDHALLAQFTSERYLRICTDLLEKNQPLIMLFGETSIGSDTAGGLSGRLGLQMISNCSALRVVEGEAAQNNGSCLQFTCQICAGKLVAEGEFHANQTHLITFLPGAFKPELGKSSHSPQVTFQALPDLGNLRIVVKQIIEPAKGDIDITKEPVLISVGRGIQQKENIELAEELAAAAGGTVTGSRPIIDQGWLPSSRLIGKSGKAVKPKIYLALGISGAPEHSEGIMASDTIIAIDTNPSAPIFNIARYGAVVDAIELLPVLTERIKEEKGG